MTGRVDIGMRQFFALIPPGTGILLPSRDFNNTQAKVWKYLSPSAIDVALRVTGFGRRAFVAHLVNGCSLPNGILLFFPLDEKFFLRCDKECITWAVQDGKESPMDTCNNAATVIDIETASGEIVGSLAIIEPVTGNTANAS